MIVLVRVLIIKEYPKEPPGKTIRDHFPGGNQSEATQFHQPKLAKDPRVFIH
jgi:hypothetical protein